MVQVIWRQVIWGVSLQFVFGLIVLRWQLGRQVLQCIGDKVTTFLDYTTAGSALVYGYLVTDQNSSGIALGTIFAFKVYCAYYYSYSSILQVLFSTILKSFTQL